MWTILENLSRGRGGMKCLELLYLKYVCQLQCYGTTAQWGGGHENVLWVWGWAAKVFRSSEGVWNILPSQTWNISNPPGAPPGVIVDNSLLLVGFQHLAAADIRSLNQILYKLHCSFEFMIKSRAKGWNHAMLRILILICLHLSLVRSPGPSVVLYVHCQ